MTSASAFCIEAKTKWPLAATDVVSMCWMLDDSRGVDNELNCDVIASGGKKVRNVTVMLIQVKILSLVLSEE